MKTSEILEKLQNGSIVTEIEYFNFKRGKIQRGKAYKYFIDEHQITSTQFDAVRSMLEKIESDVISKKFKLKIK